jgi:hypothetical protein
MPPQFRLLFRFQNIYLLAPLKLFVVPAFAMIMISAIDNALPATKKRGEQIILDGDVQDLYIAV